MSTKNIHITTHFSFSAKQQSKSEAHSGRIVLFGASPPITICPPKHDAHVDRHRRSAPLKQYRTQAERNHTAMNLPNLSARAFTAMQNLNVSQLSECTADEIRPLLPSLVRMSLLSPYDSTKTAVETRKQILSLLVGIEVVNNIVSFLQVDYHELEIDVKKEQQLR